MTGMRASISSLKVIAARESPGNMMDKTDSYLAIAVSGDINIPLESWL
jgi:hypothetical protein